jgi:N-glycosylase/DNA lyase
MKNLLESIENLRKTKIKNLVNTRIKEFKTKKSNNELFKELCFCILTANFNAEKTIKIQEEINNGFLTFSESELANKLKKLGHRYPNARAKYILEARKHKDSLKSKSRDWLVKNIKGLGYKEASHFLRNVGYDNHAIIDFHIIDLLIKNKLIQKPKKFGKLLFQLYYQNLFLH